MKTTPEALKDLHAALGGNASEVEELSTNLEMLNAISGKLSGKTDAEVIPEAIENIAEVATGGGSDWSVLQIINTNRNAKITYDFIDTSKIEVDGKQFFVIKKAVKEISYANAGTFRIPLMDGTTYLNPLNVFTNVDNTVAPTTAGNVSFDAESGLFVLKGNGTIRLKAADA